ncbi:pathogen-associated molecular patterns-induced protein A70-like [Triticum dicoccoides]|uniref:pathogen-associated molecular patterns-induced protein A70-like n=1 Tax=Triticum dicoccoides TaxID=85692 RepID=UPI00188F0EE3|nr:pathogen-associated molecular patterns-induced protein A70-like [Triticum dicoccoides]
MDGGATAAALGAWEAVQGFFTPATLFLTVNLVIGTILLTSRSHQRRRQGGHDGDHQQEPLHHVEPQQQHQEDLYYRDQQHEQQQQQYVPPPPAPAPLTRTSSVLDRLRSIGLYRFRSGDFPPEYAAGAVTDSRDVTASPEPEPAPTAGDAHHARSRSEPPARVERRRAPPSKMKRSSSEARRAEVAPAPTARVVQPAVLEEEEHDDDLVEHAARADTEFTDNYNSFTTPPPEQEPEEEQYYREEYVPPYRPAPLARAPSVLERLRSFSLYRFNSGNLSPELSPSPDHAVASVAAADEKKTSTQYSRSRSEPAREQGKKGKKPQQQGEKQGAEGKMSKSSSEARMLPPPPPPPPEVEEGGVDARADDFINSFRKQLQLQRLNSLLNYKEVLNRGAK